MTEKKRNILISLIVFLILIVILAIIFTQRKGNHSYTKTHNNIVYTINSIERLKGNEYNTATDGYEYILFNVTIENNSEEEYQYSILDWVLAKDGSEYIACGIDPENNLDVVILNPGEKISGSFAYEIPLETKGFKISYSIVSNPDEKIFEFNID